MRFQIAGAGDSGTRRRWCCRFRGALRWWRGKATSCAWRPCFMACLQRAAAVIRCAIRMHSPSLRALALSVLLGMGCGGGPSPRQEICEQILGCACAMPTYPDVEKCVADADSTAQVLEGLAEQYGLIFDAACFDRRLEQFGSALECHTPSELPDWDAEGCSFCAPVHGDAPIGAPCSNFRPDFYASDCAPDLGCFTTGGPGVCVPLCKVFAAGETCGFGTGQPILLPCEDGHRCDWESRRCEPLRADGAPCSGLTGGCASDYCGPSGVCEEPGAGGETCSEFTCAESLVCHAAKCMPLPAAGERCDDGACAADAYCDSADVCAPAQPLLCDVDIGTVDGQPRIDRA